MKNSRGLFVADGSISNFVMTEWTPEGQPGQTPKSLGLRIITRLLKKSFYSGCSKMPRYEAPLPSPKRLRAGRRNPEE